MPATKNDIITQLRKDILLLQGFKPSSASVADIRLGPLTAAFPNGVFPTGAIHEFLSEGPENDAASVGFIAALAGSLINGGRVCVWISSCRKVFPPGLRAFGIDPERVIFVNVQREREVLWAMEEALKCSGLAGVVGEVREIGFTASRRLQLAVEQSQVTGFLLRYNPRNIHAIACVARWRVTTIASELTKDMSGIGFPRWQVEVLRVRNGQPGIWQVEWSAGRFHTIAPQAGEFVRPVLAEPQEPRRKTG